MVCTAYDSYAWCACMYFGACDRIVISMALTQRPDYEALIKHDDAIEREGRNIHAFIVCWR